MIAIIRLILMIFFIGVGLFVFAVATFGLYKFDYVLNRAHAAATNDTLGAMSILIGLMFYSGLNFITLKLFIVLVFLWLANPVGTHLLVQTEVITNEDINQEAEVIE